MRRKVKKKKQNENCTIVYARTVLRDIETVARSNFCVVIYFDLGEVARVQHRCSAMYIRFFYIPIDLRPLLTVSELAESAHVSRPLRNTAAD